MAHPTLLVRSVNVVGDGSLFDEIIVHMLLVEYGLRVTRSRYLDDAAFLTEVSLSRPDVILLSESRRYSFERMPVLLAQVERATDLRFILLRVDSNYVDLIDCPAGRPNQRPGLRRTLQRVGGWGELMELIEGKQLVV